MSFKPLDGKAYGSIPHLPGSKQGRDDRGVLPKAALHFTEKTKQRDDVVYVTEKLDGSNVAVAKLADGRIEALNRAGHPCISSRWEQHRMFAAWAYANKEKFERLLAKGERVCGEWLAQAHGTRYDLSKREPFVAFDLFDAGGRRPVQELHDRCSEQCIRTVPILHAGKPIGVNEAMVLLGTNGLYGAMDEAEGAVWRIERGGQFLEIAKYVRPTHKVGRYLSSESGREEVWNYRVW